MWRIRKSGGGARGIRSGPVEYRKGKLGKVEALGYRTKRERTFGIKLGNTNAQDTAPPATHGPKKLLLVLSEAHVHRIRKSYMNKGLKSPCRVSIDRRGMYEEMIEGVRRSFELLKG